MEKNAKGYFFDVGANIGTTGIYVKKIVNTDLQIIGFEASKKNWKIHVANVYLND